MIMRLPNSASGDRERATRSFGGGRGGQPLIDVGGRLALPDPLQEKFARQASWCFLFRRLFETPGLFRQSFFKGQTVLDPQPPLHGETLRSTRRPAKT